MYYTIILSYIILNTSYNNNSNTPFPYNVLSIVMVFIFFFGCFSSKESLLTTR
jgi:hypothetical protein